MPLEHNTPWIPVLEQLHLGQDSDCFWHRELGRDRQVERLAFHDCAGPAAAAPGAKSDLVSLVSSLCCFTFLSF